MIPFLLRCVVALQVVLALRVFFRMGRTAKGARITPRPAPAGSTGRVSVLVPVLNEEERLAACLQGLLAQSDDVREIIVIDGGSTDGTIGLVERFAAAEPRLRLVSAAPVPRGVNGKAHGLAVGEAAASGETDWVLVIDADVRPAPDLVPSLLAMADSEELWVLSVATRQRLSGPSEGVLHPSLLTTLVYRFGIPGHVATDPEEVQANGQCLLVERDALRTVGGFGSVLGANAEDVTLVRSLVAAGIPAGFFEGGDLVEVAMYPSWRAAWDGWTRSLPMRDRFSTWRLPFALAEVLLVQAAPLGLWLFAVARHGPRDPLAALEGGLVAARLGVLAGMRRAYIDPPATYWLSPLVDLPVAIKLVSSALRRQFTWRGRDLIPGDHV